jgi:hypothetical protein
LLCSAIDIDPGASGRTGLSAAASGTSKERKDAIQVGVMRGRRLVDRGLPPPFTGDSSKGRGPRATAADGPMTVDRSARHRPEGPTQRGDNRDLHRR